MNLLNGITEVYIACPAKFATGGTELLHQLCNKLVKHNVNAKMFYLESKDNSPTAERFNKYKVSHVTEIPDNKSVLLIVPETFPEILLRYSKVKKVIWWLSVDNYIETRFKLKIFPLRNVINYYKYYYTLKHTVNFKDKRIIHLAQSQYAINYLKEKNVKNIDYLSDYLNDVFFTNDIDYSSSKRENIILYNPLKGKEITEKIMSKYPNYQYVPLTKLTPEGVADLCKRSKIYIDFGHHPGKDRFPREAAILGCCIITNKRGAAKYYEDIAISDEYKFEESDDSLDTVGIKINKILNNYDVSINDFEAYRNRIIGEEVKFDNDLKRLFL